MGIRINDPEAAVVQRIFREFVVEGKSLNEIANGLTADEIPKGHRSRGTGKDIIQRTVCCGRVVKFTFTC